jgi:leader peptidase (prepilin peptidase)/N-methyltransferase
MTILQLIFLFIFGTVFGSFGSVLLWRMKDKLNRTTIKGILYGRSECPGCHKALTVGQLIPLWWWLWQRGKCFRCKKPISSLYPVLELVSGLIFVMRGLWVMSYGLWVTSILLLAIRWLLGLLLVRDMYTYELHMPLFIVLCLVVGVLWIMNYELWIIWYGLVFFLVFLWIYYFGLRYSQKRFGVRQETFGFGDVLLAPVLWVLLWLYYTGSTQPLAMIVLYFILGSCFVGLAYYAFVSLIRYIIPKTDLPDSNHEMNTPMIPFFPAMIVMYFIMILS